MSMMTSPLLVVKFQGIVTLSPTQTVIVAPSDGVGDHCRGVTAHIIGLQVTSVYVAMLASTYEVDSNFA